MPINPATMGVFFGGKGRRRLFSRASVPWLRGSAVARAQSREQRAVISERTEDDGDFVRWRRGQPPFVPRPRGYGVPEKTEGHVGNVIRRGESALPTAGLVNREQGEESESPM